MDILKRNNVKITGEGKQPIMFAHGFGCDQNMWRFITPAFEKEYRVILFDYVGAGKSETEAYSSEKYKNLYGYAQDILDICEVLDLQHLIFVGHSVSSMIGLLAAIKRPAIFSNIILVGPSPRYINEGARYTGGFEKKDIEDLLDTMDKNYIGWANFLAPAVMKNPEHPELTAELTESFCSTDPKIAREFAEVTFLSDNREDLAKVNLPVLVIQCSEDLIAPIEVGEYVHSNIQGSKFKLLKATGHCPHMSAPEETIQVIKAYLADSKN